ncbi:MULTISPECIES: hypothetical protein [Streptomyces]|uniref:hypothetical protein n=1 Tax=Streptomyces TaxID=1883 RepID=UPI00073DDDB0|nr:hypothetical protein [Streptomyces sp. FBKL.4005]CUW33397.1 hypothetical protein TUE45_pSRTUE45a_0029 [Streptomyces reticuli]
MTSIERTAYPRFKRLITAHELHLFSAPTREEATWAAERDIDDGGPAQAALAKADEMTAGAVAALQGLDEQASVEEVARRLDGEVSPAVLDLMKALLVQVGGRGTRASSSGCTGRPTSTPSARRRRGARPRSPRCRPVRADRPSFWRPPTYFGSAAAAVSAVSW